MKRSALLLAALAVTAAGLVLVWNPFAPIADRSGASATSTSQEEAAQAGPPEEGVAPLRRESVDEARDAKNAAAPPPATGPATPLQVRVLWEDTRHPVAGLPLRLTFAGDQRPPAGGATDVTGACNFTIPHGVEHFTVVSGGNGDAPSFRRSSAVTAAPGRGVTLTVHLPRSGVLAGTVKNAAGAGIAAALHLQSEGRAGAGVRADRDEEEATDEAGAFRFEGVVGDFDLQVAADGYPVLESAGHLEAGAALTRQVLRLPAARPVRVLVQTADGEAIAQAQVEGWRWLPEAGDAATSYLRPRRLRAGGVSAADGACTLAVEQDQSWQLKVEHGEFPPWTGVVAPGQDEVVVVLGSSFTVQGLVLDAHGDPLPGARILLWIPSRGDPPRLLDFVAPPIETRSDPEGAFRLPVGNPTERGLLVVHAGDHAVHADAPLALDPGKPPLEIRLSRERPLAGVVVHPNGEPAAGLRITALGQRFVHQSAELRPRPSDEQLVTARYASWAGLAGLDESRSGDDGGFRFTGLRDGHYELRVFGERRHEALALVTVPAGREDLRIVLGAGLERLLGVRGRVTAAGTGAPVTAFRFGVHRERDDADEPLRVGRDFTDASGRFELHGIEPGSLAFTVKAQGYATWVQGFDDVGEGVLDLEIALHPLREVEVELVDPRGQPLPACELRVYSPDGERLPAGGPGAFNPESFGRPAETDARGRARLVNLPATPVLLEIGDEDDGFGPARRIPLDATHPLPQPHRIEVPDPPAPPPDGDR